MSWKLKYSDWYQKEINELSSSLIYKEYFRSFDKILVSTGELLIRRKKFVKYPILIIYPKSTPFKPPKIYILKEILNANEVQQFSTEVSNRYEILETKKKLLYLRHQMSDGQVCFIEFDNIYDNKPEIYSISDIINRIKKWLIGIETGDIPYDNNEVEFFYHFPAKNNDINILLPQIFYNTDLHKGELFLSLYPSSNEKNTFLGVRLAGQNINGISLLPQTDPVFSKFEVCLFPNILDVFLKTDLLKEEIEKGRIIEGSWWTIDKEPKPFTDLNDIILNGFLSNEDIFNSLFYDHMHRGYKKAYIGLRFYNRRRELEWIIFELEKRGNNPHDIFKIESDIPIVISNYIIKAIRTRKFTDDAHHLRNQGRADRIRLKEKNVSIIGCGALGSEIADIIGKAGIGSINLIDNQVIEQNNPIRHLCGLGSLFNNKSLSTAIKIVEHNPFVLLEESSYFSTDIYLSNINTYIKDNGIGISSIAEDNTESYLNEQAIINDKIIFYSRVLRGGKVGRIFRVIPGVDACFRCILQYKLENDPLFIDIPEDENYKTILNECNNPIRPASAADIKLIASLTSRIIIDFLQESTESFNHWIFYSESFGNMVIHEDESMKTKKMFIPPHPNCPICSTKEQVKTRILKKVFEFIKDEVTQSKNIETGGILIGFKGRNNFVYICKATGPGPKAKRTENWFERDVQYCQSILNEEYEKYKDKGLYVGEWHYHPNVSNKPSNRDLISLSEIAEAENYLVDEPLMIIFSNTMNCSVTVHPVGKRYYYTDFEILDKDCDEI